MRSRSGIDLTLVLRFIVMSVGSKDETVRIKRPFFIPADSNRPTSSSRSGVGSGPGPMENSVVSLIGHGVQGHEHVRKRGHEARDRRADRGTSNGWSTTVDDKRS